MKNESHLILTVDYEIFGNGSGDVDCCIINPAKKILDVANLYKAPVTFFVEALEFMAFENNSRTSEKAAGIKKQIKDAVSDGHDAQLHLHPQWSQSEYHETDGWTVDTNRWRIGDLSQIDIDHMVKEGKKWLEDLLKNVKSDYQCNSFRAGGWCIQPSDRVLKALIKNNFKIDSTVAPNIRKNTKREWSDFRYTPNKPFWMTHSDVCTENTNGLIAEIPITTGRISPFLHFQSKKNILKQSNNGLAASCLGSYREPESLIAGMFEKIRKIFQLGNAMLDFSTMPVDILIEITKQWMKEYDNSETPIPLVAIAHTKNFTDHSSSALRNYLYWAKDKNIKFSTYSDWYDIAVR